MNVNICGPDEDTWVKVDPLPAKGVIDWTEYQEVIEQCARNTWWRFKQFCELEDLQQTGWLYFFENRRVLDALPRDTYGMTFVRRRIQSACNVFAFKEMSAKTGIQWEDQHRYGAGEIRFLVALAFAGGLVGGESSDVIAGYVDVGKALASSCEQDQEALWFAYGPTRGDGRLTVTERSRAHRAIKRIMSILNGETAR